MYRWYQDISQKKKKYLKKIEADIGIESGIKKPDNEKR